MCLRVKKENCCKYGLYGRLVVLQVIIEDNQSCLMQQSALHKTTLVHCTLV